MQYEPCREKAGLPGFPPGLTQTVKSQKLARSLKFWISEEEKLYNPSSKNKGADQLRSYCKADLRLCFYHMKKIWFSHDAAHI